MGRIPCLALNPTHRAFGVQISTGGEHHTFFNIIQRLSFITVSEVNAEKITNRRTFLLSDLAGVEIRPSILFYL